MHAYTFESRIDVEMEICAVVGRSGQIKLAWRLKLIWSSALEVELGWKRGLACGCKLNVGLEYTCW